MKNKTKYTNEPMGRPKVVDDFLPPPEQLVLKEDTVKVTIALNKSNVEFFKEQAKIHHTFVSKDDQAAHRSVCVSLSKELIEVKA